MLIGIDEIVDKFDSIGADGKATSRIRRPSQESATKA